MLLKSYVFEKSNTMSHNIKCQKVINKITLHKTTPCLIRKKHFKKLIY